MIMTYTLTLQIALLSTPPHRHTNILGSPMYMYMHCYSISQQVATIQCMAPTRSALNLDIWRVLLQ